MELSRACRVEARPTKTDANSHFRPGTFGERGRIVQTISAVSGIIFNRRFVFERGAISFSYRLGLYIGAIAIIVEATASLDSPGLPGMKMNAEAWENCLTEHYLRSDGPYGGTPITFIDATPEELAAASGQHGRAEE